MAGLTFDRLLLVPAVVIGLAIGLGSLLRPGVAHFVMLTLLALSVVASFRVVGTLLVFGLLVVPPANAVLLVRRIPIAMIVAVGFGWLSVVLGLAISYHADTAASATMAGVAVAQFFVVLTAIELRASIDRRRRVATP